MTNRKQLYRTYLESDHWARLKVEAGNRWGYVCFACERCPVEFHHLTYRENLIECTADDVIPLCRGCHQGVHFRGVLSRTARRAASNDEKRSILRTGLLEIRRRILERNGFEARRMNLRYQEKVAALRAPEIERLQMLQLAKLKHKQKVNGQLSKKHQRRLQELERLDALRNQRAKLEQAPIPSSYSASPLNL